MPSTLEHDLSQNVPFHGTIQIKDRKDVLAYAAYFSTCLSLWVRYSAYLQYCPSGLN